MRAMEALRQMGVHDASNGRPSRAKEFKTVSEQLEYRDGYNSVGDPDHCRDKPEDGPRCSGNPTQDAAFEAGRAAARAKQTVEACSEKDAELRALWVLGWEHETYGGLAGMENVEFVGVAGN